jgi:hypothetical protein
MSSSNNPELRKQLGQYLPANTKSNTDTMVMKLTRCCLFETNLEWPQLACCVQKEAIQQSQMHKIETHSGPARHCENVKSVQGFQPSPTCAS